MNEYAPAGAGPKVLQSQGFMPVEPRPKAVPHVWHWRDVRPQALKMAEEVHDRERRVVGLRNPGLQAIQRMGALNTLSSGVQIVMPGEVARAHRHTQAALRFVIESKGGYTVVNGDRVPMLPGDLVLTPNWNWHDHCNDTDAPMIWLDGLDSPLIGLLECEFYEEHPDLTQPFGEEKDRSLTRYGGRALMPRWEEHRATHSPLLHYPWEEVQSALKQLASTADASPHDGVILEYTNPATGGPVMPTISCYIQMLRPGEETAVHRHTCNTVYHVVEDEGRSLVNGQDLDWEEKDVFCVPTWAYHKHTNATDKPAVLFSYTDRPVYEALSLYREDAP